VALARIIYRIPESGYGESYNDSFSGHSPLKCYEVMSTKSVFEEPDMHLGHQDDNFISPKDSAAQGQISGECLITRNDGQFGYAGAALDASCAWICLGPVGRLTSTVVST